MMKEKKLSLPRLWGEKLILIIIFLLFTLFFSNDFGLIDIQKTAIILATGVDKTETGNFKITAQIAVPQASKSGGQTAAVAISGEGETVAEAFKEINAKTGWFPKLIFCDLVILGEQTLKSDVFDCLGYFLRNEYMSDNCLLAACEGTAEEILNAQIPTENMTSLALQKILATEAKEAGNISTVNLKDFSAGYYAEHKSGFMPYVRAVSQAEGKGQGGQSSGEGGSQTFNPLDGNAVPAQGGQSGGQKSGGSGGSEEQKIFDASQTAVFYGGKQVGLLTKEQSFAVNLVLNSIRQATLEVPLNENVYALGLTGVSSKIKFKVEDNTPHLNVELKATARVSDCSSSRSLTEISDTNVVKPEILKEAEEILEKNLSDVFETCREVKCDIFEVLDKLQKFENRYHSAYKDVVLDRVIPSFSVKISDAS